MLIHVMDYQTKIFNLRFIIQGDQDLLYLLEVLFEVLVRRQIGRLSDPSIQWTQFIHNELVKMSYSSMVNELQRYPVLRKWVVRFWEDFCWKPFEMELDYINTSHPNFIGGSRALEMAQQQIRSSMIVVPLSRQRDGGESDTTQVSERSSRSIAIVRSPANGFTK